MRDAPLSVECAGVEAFAFDPEGALLAARTLLDEACAARVHGYISVQFYDADGLLIRSLDGSQLAAVWAAEREAIHV